MKERPFDTLSGPWTGWSIQYGNRLTERMSYTIKRGGDGVQRFRDCALIDAGPEDDDILRPITIRGWGTDVDGDFTMDGFFEPANNQVHMVRRYIRAPRNPSQVGYPFLYEGKWNGYCISGQWMSSRELDNCGPFEMWPESAEEELESMFDDIDSALAMPAGV